MTSQEIRQQFIDFFKDKEHTFVRSSSVVPTDDPTLLFTNAGMNQFKPYFLNQESPKYLRATNSQKCIRVSGKHNDLEEVGVDNYHHTFFEMLGNWSFGDYYKEDAISWAWELLTEVWKLDKKRLWVTIYKDDEEAGAIWKSTTDISPTRILKFSEKDNFWEMGETGPCGPCTEIHYYTGNDVDNQNSAGVNDLSEYREIWNLVFIQNNREADGSLSDLPAKHVDTGAGFERIVAILNGKESNYETDLFIPILDKISAISGKSIEFKDGVPHQVIADHLRMLSFSIADGALPSNGGRGYVLRRVLRRASRFGRLLDLDKPFIYSLVSTLVDVMGDAFPELKEKQSHIEKVIQAEETSFGSTLDKGLERFSKIISPLEKGGEISGEETFKLYDTYGFPLDLTELLARENQLSVDADGFESCMSSQRERARSAGKFILNLDEGEWVSVSSGESSKFLGYESLESESKIRRYRKNDNHIEIILDQTPFYAESGGQVGDTGIFSCNDFSFEVSGTIKHQNEFIHVGQIKSGSIENIKAIHASVTGSRREKIRLNHTATHLLHQALKDVLGAHVQQAGSLVAADKLRFDLTHYERMSEENLQKIEMLVNLVIRENHQVDTKVMNFDDAKESGAIALFGEKYEDDVRVVNIEGFSKELCGGTHVSRTGDIGIFKIISETALSSGVRRIEAITGAAVSKLLSKNDTLISDVKHLLKCADSEIIERLESVVNEKKILEREIKKINQSSQGSVVEDLVASAEIINGYKIVVEQLDNVSDFKEMGDSFRQHFNNSGIALIGTKVSGKPMVMCAVSDDLTAKIKAGDIVRSVGQFIGGGGGGKAHLATAGGKDISKLQEALESGKKLIIQKLGNNE